MSIFDSTFGLTEREQKALDRSWAKIFSEDVFPQIDEERFSVLYSDKASRPNTPVNVIVGALIIKELFAISDDEVVDNLMLDPRYQMALHTSSFKEQPLSDKSLSRFRIRRMDSLMVEANIRKLSRMELIYTCISKLVSYLHKTGKDDLIGHMAHYYDPDDFNITTDLTGRDVDPIMGAFQFSEDGTKVTRCPAGNSPKTCWYNQKTGQILLSFNRDKCAGCPYQQNCRPKIFKKVSKLSVSLKMKKRAIVQSRMQTEEFKLYSRLRNGVETIPSLLKNQYGVNRMPVRGKIRCKFFFGCKVAALNFRKLFRFRQGSGNYALNPAVG